MGPLEYLRDSVVLHRLAIPSPSDVIAEFLLLLLSLNITHVRRLNATRSCDHPNLLSYVQRSISLVVFFHNLATYVRSYPLRFERLQKRPR
jgi:hypothetical protein